MDAFVIKQHDTQPSLVATLTDDNGPIVVPNGAVVTFIMRGPYNDEECDECYGSSDPIMYGAPTQSRPSVVVNNTAIVVNGATGDVRYDWRVGDTSKVGRFSGEFKISLATLLTTYPSVGYIPIIVNSDLS